jgi:hypothetical protein
MITERLVGGAETATVKNVDYLPHYRAKTYSELRIIALRKSNDGIEQSELSQ